MEITPTAGDGAGNWNLVTPGFDVRIDPDPGGQMVTGPAEAGAVGTLGLGHGAGRTPSPRRAQISATRERRGRCG